MVSFVFTTKYTTSLITVCLHDTHHRRNFNLWASNFLGTPSFWNRCSSSQWNCTDLLSQISQFEFYSPTCLLAAGVGGCEWNLHDSYCKAYLVKSIHINQSFKTSRSCESCILQPWGTLRNGPALVWSVLSDPPELAWNHCLDGSSDETEVDRKQTFRAFTFMDPSYLRKRMWCYRNITTNSGIILLVCVLENALLFYILENVMVVDITTCVKCIYIK